MATYRVTEFFFDTINDVGWTENWWVAGSTADGVASTWESAVTPSRLALLLDTCKILTTRACNVDHPRDSAFNNTHAGSGTISHSAQSPDAPWSALLIRRDVATNNLFGHIFMRGIPQTIFVGRVYTPGSGYGVTFDANLLSYKTALISNTALLRKGPPPYTYPQFQTFSGLIRVERKPGRPFGLFRGRRATA